ncbi:MAG: hypothetical protein E4H38_02885, partial [Gemmatimonadales bacterium]
MIPPGARLSVRAVDVGHEGTHAPSRIPAGGAGLEWEPRLRGGQTKGQDFGPEDHPTMLQTYDEKNRDILVNINGTLVHRDQAG